MIRFKETIENPINGAGARFAPNVNNLERTSSIVVGSIWYGVMRFIPRIPTKKTAVNIPTADNLL